MKKTTYADKLKDPRWQKKRLQIFERDNFSCKLCGDRSTELNVHHHLYEKGKEPWEYSNDVLETYCRKCHSMVEYFKKEYPKLSIVKNIYKEKYEGEYHTVFVVCLEKTKVLLAIFRYYGEGRIELNEHIPSNVIKMVASLINLQSNG